MSRKLDDQMIDIKKICVLVLSQILINFDQWHHAPDQYATEVISTIVCRTAQGFGCDVKDCEFILKETRDIIHKELGLGTLDLTKVNVFNDGLPDFGLGSIPLLPQLSKN